MSLFSILLFLGFLAVFGLGIWVIASEKSLGRRQKRVGVALLLAVPGSLVLGLVVLLIVGLISGDGADVAVLLLFLLVALIAFYVWVIVAVGSIAAHKGYSKAGFIIFTIFLPVVAIVVVLVLQPSSSQKALEVNATLVKCPACAELIQPEAIKCKHCGETVKPSSTPEGV
jgi:hypothetical protein